MGDSDGYPTLVVADRRQRLFGWHAWAKQTELEWAPRIEEVYHCDARGIVSVEVVNHSSGYRQSYCLRE